MAAFALPALVSSLLPASMTAVGGVAGALSTGAKIATFAATVVGSYIDSAFIMPRLLKDNDSGEAKNVQITGLDEGDPHIFAVGPRTRIGGFLYFAPKRARFTKGRRGGGKGGGSSKSGSPDRYNNDGAYIITRTGVDLNTSPPQRYPADGRLSRVWLDGKLRYYGDDASRSQSTGYEIYESVENDGGFVSLVYTIQGKTVDPPGGGNTLLYGFDDRFLPGDNMRCFGSLTQPTNHPYANLGGSYGELLGDYFEYEESDEATRPLKLLSAGFFADGRPYVQLEWQYYLDKALKNRFGTRINPSFYGRGPSNGAFGLSETTVAASGKIPFEQFSDSTWIPPLLTQPALSTNGVQQRGYAEYAGGAPGVNVIVAQSYAPFEKGLAADMRMLDGEVSTPIDIIVREEGDSPALTSFSTLIIDNLNLTDFGNRMPNVEVEMRQDADFVPIGDAIYRILCVHGDLPADKLDVSALEGTGIAVTGYWWTAPFGVDVLQPLVIAYDLAMLEREGVVTFRRRVDNPEYDIPAEDLGVEFEGEGKYFRVRESAQKEAVIETTVTYTDSSAGMSKGATIFRRPDLLTGSSQSIDLARLSLTSEEAREIAQRVTWQASMHRQEVDLSLGPKWGFLGAGDVINFEAYGDSWRVVISELTRGEDGTISVTGYQDDGVVEDMPLLSTDLGGAPTSKESTYVPPDTKVVAMDIGPLNAEDALTPGLYLAGSAKLFGADWRGGTWAGSVGSVSTPPTGSQTEFLNRPEYQFIDTTFDESSVGTLVTGFPLGVKDLINTIESPVLIRLMEGELESAPEDENVYEREYLLYVNGEVIAFRDVALVPDPEYGGPLYQLTGPVLRGLYNTEHLISGHPAGSPVVFILQETIDRVTVPVESIDNVELRYCLFPSGSENPIYEEETYGVDIIHAREVAGGAFEGTGRNAGANGRPFPPSHLRSTSELTVNNLDFWKFSGLSYEVDDRVKTVDAQGALFAWVCVVAHNPVDEEEATGNDHYPPNEGVGAYWELIDPSPRDFRLRWNFRTPIPVATLPTTSADTLRGVTTFSVRIYDNIEEPGPEDLPVREIRDIFSNEYLYTDQDRFEDGIGAVFWAEVRADTDYMTSEWVGRTLPSNG